MQNRILTALMLMGVIGLTACASPDTSVGRFKVGKPYSIKGETYYPEENYTFTETGIASWYGPGFNGKKTASGEAFDENALTAAHKTLQLPSLVRVTNLENGKSIVVRVTDRGPFHGNRVIDLSKGAADLLDFRRNGTAKVKLQVLGPESQALAQAAKRKMDTRGAEIALNNTGRLDERFTGFLPPEYQQPEAIMTAAAEPAAVETQTTLTQQTTTVAWNSVMPPQAPAVIEPAPAPQIPAPKDLNTSYEPAIVRGRTAASRYPGIPVATLEPEDLAPRYIPNQPVHAETVPVRPSYIYIQTGSFVSLPNAQRNLSQVSALGPTKIVTANLGGKPYYRVRIGPIESVDKADTLVNTLEHAGRQATIVVSEN